MHQKHRWPNLRQHFFLLLGVLSALPAMAEQLVTDMAGRQIKLPDRIQRVYAVGHCIPVVGAIAPEKLANSSRLSDEARRFLAPSLYEGKATPQAGQRFSDEEILKMAPDLVVMEAQSGAAEQAGRLEARLHVPVILIDQDLLKARQAFALLGKVLGHPEQARVLSDFVTTYLDPIREQAKAIPAASKVKVYYAEGPDGLSTNPAGSAHTQVLDFVGADNVARVGNIPGEAMNGVSLEQLYLWQPELILVWTPGADQLTTWHAIVDDPLWQKLTAVKRGRVVQIPWLPLSWFDRPPGSNRILGVLWLAQLLYPEKNKFDLPAVTREYFRKFYHTTLSDADARHLLGLAQPSGFPHPGAAK